jgi:hypothetical protein
VIAAVIAVLVLPATAATAQTDLLAGRWNVVAGGAAAGIVVDIEATSAGNYVGRVVEKDASSTVCWPLDAEVMHLTGTGHHFSGDVLLYIQGFGCDRPQPDGTITIDVNDDGTRADVTLVGNSIQCVDCEPETWTRNGPPPLAVANSSADIPWPIVAGVAAALVLALAALITTLIRRSRVRRRALAQPQIQFAGNLGLPSVPTVRTGPSPNLNIRIEPALRRGEPTAEEIQR